MPRNCGRAAPVRATPTKAAPAAGSNYPVIKTKAVVDQVVDYYKLTLNEKRIKDRLDAPEPDIIEAVGGAPVAYVGDGIVKVTEVAGSEGTPSKTITREMIGQVIPGTKGRKGTTFSWGSSDEDRLSQSPRPHLHRAQALPRHRVVLDPGALPSLGRHRSRRRAFADLLPAGSALGSCSVGRVSE